MIKRFQLAMILLLCAHYCYSQKLQATVQSGAHLIRTTNWGAFAYSPISVEHLDGSNKHVYLQNPFNSNPNAMHVPGLDADFAQNTPVMVYVLKPLIKVIDGPKISAKVSSVNHPLIHGHLPEIPSAAEINKDGVELGEMNKKLLRKIEELTLYLIQENRVNMKNTKRLEAQEAQIRLLKEKLDRIGNKH